LSLSSRFRVPQGTTSKKVVVKNCGELSAADPAFLDKD